MTSQVEDLKPLTSLRFLAAAAIVLLHATMFFPTWLWLKHVPALAVQGVSFFFVLSGFILTHVYKSKPYPGYFNFISSRIARLWPVHLFATLLLFLFVGGGHMTYSGPGVFDRNFVLLFNLSMVQSLVPTTSYVFSWNALSWSISTEYFFYLAFPFLLINIEKTWAWKIALFAIIGAISFPAFRTLGLPATTDDPYTVAIYPFIYANPLSRAVQFSTGMATWIFWDRYIRRSSLPIAAWVTIEIAAVITLVVWLQNFDELLQLVPSNFAMWARINGCTLPFAILIAVMASGRGLFGIILSTRSFVWLGEISYSIYLLHLVLMQIFAHQLPSSFSKEWIYFSTLFAMSALSFRFVETPGKQWLIGLHRRLADKFLRRRPPPLTATQPLHIPRSKLAK